MSTAVIVLDANKLAEAGILQTEFQKTGKLSWNITTAEGPKTLTMKYTVDTIKSQSSVKLEYRISFNGRAEDLSYRISLENQKDSAGVTRWNFICPVTNKSCTRLMLHPGEKYFRNDPRSVIRSAVTNTQAAEMLGSAPRPAPTASRPVVASRPTAAAAPSRAVPADPMAEFGIMLRQYFDGKGLSLDENALDPFVRFGLQLFALGAANAMASSGRLERARIGEAVGAGLTAMGMSNQRVPEMMQRQEEYFGIPKYALMMQMGEDVFFAWNNREPTVATKIADAMNKWRSRVEIKNETNLLCFMFTDIVSSVAFTQEHGDRVMHELVSSHNYVVRSALRANNGREVKHTGDGIMAVFDRSSDAISCAIQIQQDIKLHNGKSDTEYPLAVRIGVNAGEARVEDNDYLGTAVQLAARVCAAAGAEEILVSSTTRDLAAGFNFKYSNERELTLKGFAERRGVSSVVY